MIPIQNLYYLLVYAWDHGLKDSGLDRIHGDRCPDLNNFLAVALLESTTKQIRRGLDRSYVNFAEDTSRIRGKINFSESIKRLTHIQGRLHCEFDEFSRDILHNRILKTCLEKLSRDPHVHSRTRNELTGLLDHFWDVSTIRIQRQMFQRLRLPRHSKSYQFLMHICELVHSSLLPEKTASGRLRFHDFLQDEVAMRMIFEKFVFNFSKRHFPEAEVSAMQIRWDRETHDLETERLIPVMKTDVTLKWPERKVILDCKYYKKALVGGQYGGERFDTSNLYQLHSYLINQAVHPGWNDVEGILLYPSNGYSLNHEFTLHGKHRVRILTIDLQQRWQQIESDLMALLGHEGASVAL